MRPSRDRTAPFSTTPMPSHAASNVARRAFRSRSASLSPVILRLASPADLWRYRDAAQSRVAGGAMAGYHFATALTPEGWRSDLRIEIRDGLIASLAAGCAPEPEDERHAIALPGMPNLHSHAFQRGMAGLAEFRGSTPDSFWTWRE